MSCDATQGCTFETTSGVGGLAGQQKSLLRQCGLAGGVERYGADSHQRDKEGSHENRFVPRASAQHREPVLGRQNLTGVARP